MAEAQKLEVVKVEKAKVEESKIIKSGSFKEGTNVVAELSVDEKKALDELKQLIQDALNKHEFTAKEEEKPVAEKKRTKERREKKRSKFLRWRIQFLEKSIRKFDFTPNGINTFVQVIDLKNLPASSKMEFRQASSQALNLLQDNYPEFVAKQDDQSFPERMKSKFVFASPSKSAETLIKYTAPEQVPVQYGGLNREGEEEFTVVDDVTGVTIKPKTKHTIGFPINKKSSLVWELRVVGWDVKYGAEFVPTAEDVYDVIISETRKVSSADETVISGRFETGNPGKVVLTIGSQTFKKKELLYRSKLNLDFK
ncbi:Patellin-5 [Hibiscus syriacus]|uniref:Patellin-5 n=1 Tax=Hibiscus syriacus TaxID=106335 RepID=A0A6A2Y6W5_HIBSY|nr:Patellin-5 [Hibiscus syriacus]